MISLLNSSSRFLTNPPDTNTISNLNGKKMMGKGDAKNKREREREKTRIMGSRFVIHSATIEVQP
jgi:hypothetical protein